MKYVCLNKFKIFTEKALKIPSSLNYSETQVFFFLFFRLRAHKDHPKQLDQDHISMV